MKVKLSKGVLSKDGTPYATNTIHAVRINGYNTSFPYAVSCLCRLLLDMDVESISVIDGDNNQFDITEIRS